MKRRVVSQLGSARSEVAKSLGISEVDETAGGWSADGVVVPVMESSGAWTLFGERGDDTLVGSSGFRDRIESPEFAA